MGDWRVYAGVMGLFFNDKPAICNARPATIQDQHWSQNNQSGERIPQQRQNPGWFFAFIPAFPQRRTGSDKSCNFAPGLAVAACSAGKAVP